MTRETKIDSQDRGPPKTREGEGGGTVLHYLFIEGFRFKKGGRKIERFKGIKQTQGKRDRKAALGVWLSRNSDHSGHKRAKCEPQKYRIK